MRPASPKQHSILFRFTGLKFWEPETPPPPTIEQASAMITSMFDWDKERNPTNKDTLKFGIVPMVQVFFPDWDGSTLRHAWFGRKHTQNTPTAPQHHQETLPLPGTDDQDQKTNDTPPSPSAGPSRTPSSNPETTPQTTSGTSGSNDTEAQKQRIIDKMRKMREARARKAEERKNGTTSNPAETKKDTPAEETEEAETPEEAAKQANGHAHHEDPTVNAIIRAIKAGLKNLWLYGPAGSGKTWGAMEAAKVLNLPITILSCSAGTSASDFVGRRLPTVEPSPVSAAIGLSGIIVLDEVTMLDPAIAAVSNAMLANSIIQTTHGAIERKAVIIATSNTTGDGANRQYIGNNQLDAATLDRFTGGMIQVNYNTEYELKTFPKDVFNYVSHLREVIRENSFRRIASTRSMIAAAQIKAIGGDWENDIVSNWTPEEKARI